MGIGAVYPNSKVEVKDISFPARNLLDSMSTGAFDGASNAEHNFPGVGFKKLARQPMETQTHNRGRDGPLCGGLCKFGQVNSLTPYEEIQAEIERRRRIEEAKKRLGE
jgi:hypothetical protein